MMQTFHLYIVVALTLQQLAPTAGYSVANNRRATPLRTSGTVRLNSHSSAAASVLFARTVEPVVNNRHSASDWFYNVRTLYQSEILREVRGPCLAVAAWSAAISVLHAILPTAAAMKMCIPGTMHSFLVSALGLLLVFRTNSAYQRFNEGRKIWEHILSVSRNLSRLINLYSQEVGSSRQRRILNMVAAFPYLLRLHIRPGCLCKHSEEITAPVGAHFVKLPETRMAAVETRHEGDEIRTSTRIAHRDCWVDKRELPWRLFTENDSISGSKVSTLSQVIAANNRPLWVCDHIGQLIMQIPYGPNFTSRERLTMLGKVEKLTNAVGQCERIHQTAVPLNYARHSLRSLTLWLFTLPFCLIKDMGLLTAPVAACIAWILFGVYQIGYTIEDPFQGSLRLSILCDAISRDVLGTDDATSQNVTTAAKDMWWDNADDKQRTTSNSIMDHLRNGATAQQYQFLPMFQDEEKFLKATPKLVEENGTWSLVDLVERP